MLEDITLVSKQGRKLLQYLVSNEVQIFSTPKISTVCGISIPQVEESMLKSMPYGCP